MASKRLLPAGIFLIPFSLFLLTLSGTAGAEPSQERDPERPNVVILFAADPGYANPGSYAPPMIRMPHLDELAQKGTRPASFHLANMRPRPCSYGDPVTRTPRSTGRREDTFQTGLYTSLPLGESPSAAD